MSYLHGIEIKQGARRAILSAPDTSVVALIGTAPKGVVNEVKLITSIEAARAEYGPDVAGFTIPAALEVLFEAVGVKVLVCNVLATDKAAALLDDEGKMTRTEGGEPITALYQTTLPEAVDYTAQLTAGIEAMLHVDDAVGVKPNIVLVPGYSGIEAVMGKMIAVADKLEGFSIVDIVASSVADALTARTSGVYNVTSQAAVLCYPQVVRHNTNEGTKEPMGLSVYWAASKALRDAREGYWLSPSNTELQGVAGLTVPVSSSLTDAAADTNLLNGAGIVTVFRKSGLGSRLWGNWTAAFPSSKTPDGMIAPRAVRMAIRGALVDATLAYMDRSATGITVDRILGDVNAFLRNLIGSGAIVDGQCAWSADKNPAQEVAQGKLTFTLSIQYAPSLEKLTFEEIVEF